MTTVLCCCAGPYCNHYFLKRLAAIGRGMNDVAFRPHAIQSVMERMLAAAALPMLSDVQIRVQVSWVAIQHMWTGCSNPGPLR
jgi:hypothetical protein